MATVSNINPGGTYDIIQTVFKLSMMSNLANGITGESASQIQTQLATDIANGLTSAKAQIGPWSLVWGPVVFQYNQSGVSDNAMYVAHNASINCYVVAVAATNMNSHYDIYQLDLNVGSPVAFPLGIAPQNSKNPATQNVGNVSLGAALGVTNLLNMQDPTTGQSLQTFLNNVPKTTAIEPGPKLIFTGHSLGGSLSPTLAAWLYPNASAGWQGLYVMPTAGPATGDQGFCNNFGEVFPPTTVSGVHNPAYGFFNELIWNEYDCVPHAWTNIMNVEPYEPQNDIVWEHKLLSCRSIYGELKGVTADEVYAVINYLYQRASGQNYARFTAAMFAPASPPPAVTSFKEFETTAGNEHVVEYESFFGVSLDSREKQIGISLLAPLLPRKA